MKYLAVKNYKRFQHYKHRSPPWIKLHAILMHDYEFLSLPEISQRHVIFLWLLASKHNNRLPYDLAYITSAISARSAVDIEFLIVENFLQLRDDNRATPETGKRRKRKRQQVVTPPQDASTALAPRQQEPIPSRVETEGERETEKETTPAKRGGWVADWGTDWEEQTHGIAPFGEIGKHCKPIVELKGLEAGRAAWRVFVASDDVRFGPAYFKKHYGKYESGPRLVQAGGLRSGMIEW